MSDREAIEFLQALLVGKVAYDREDPQHVRQLGAACQLVEHAAAVAALAPELKERLAGVGKLDAKARRDPAALLERQRLLEDLGQALLARAQELERDIDELREEAEAKAALASASEWRLGGPDDRHFEGVVAIDVGTSNLASAHWNFQAADPVVSGVEPVAVNVLDAGAFDELRAGSYLSGTRALRHRSQVNLYRSFRRFIGTQHRPAPAITGNQKVAVDARRLMAAAIKDALRTLTQQVATSSDPLHFPHLVVTVPASGDLAFEYELRRVFESLDVPGSAEIDEATAAGVYYLLRPILVREYAQEGSEVTPADYYARRYGMVVEEGSGRLLALCVDFGGGTTDLSLLELTLDQDRHSCRVHVDVVATAGFPDLSGEGLTLRLFHLLKRRLALALADPTRALTGAPGPAGEHPWLAYHQFEKGPLDMYMPKTLEEDLARAQDRWDEIAGRGPLDDELAKAVDRLFPTAWKDVEASKSALKFRRANFRWLWDEAERLKRRISARRADLPPPASGEEMTEVRERMRLDGAPSHPRGVDLAKRVGAAGVDVEHPPVATALTLGSDDVDAYVAEQGDERLRAAIGRLSQSAEGRVERVLLAGNGARDVRFEAGRVLTRLLDLTPEQVEFHPEDAKVSVARGACLWAIGDKLEGFHVSMSRRPRHPHALALVSATRHVELFEEGAPISRFAYAQPEHREHAGGEKLILVDRVVSGRLQPFLMFSPKKGRPLRPLAELPIAQRDDIVLPDPDDFLDQTRDGPRVLFEVRDPASYMQLDVEWVSQWEMFERLRQEMTMEEAVAWIECSDHLAKDPPQGRVYHRYYMDETRELWLVYHSEDGRLLCRGEVTEKAWTMLRDEQDPFSGVH